MNEQPTQPAPVTDALLTECRMKYGALGDCIAQRIANSEARAVAEWRQCAERTDAKMLQEQKDHNITIDRLLVVKAERDAAVQRAEAAEAECVERRRKMIELKKSELDGESLLRSAWKERDALRLQVAALKTTCLDCKRYILDEGNDRTMAPMIEKIDDALAATASVPPPTKSHEKHS